MHFEKSLSWRYSVVAITMDSDLLDIPNSINPGSNPGSAFFNQEQRANEDETRAVYVYTVYCT